MGRTAYWGIVLPLIFISGVAFALIDSAYGRETAETFGRWAGLALLILIVAASAFRLQDAGRSEVWLATLFVPLFNLIAIMVIGLLPTRVTDLSEKSYENPF